ncbi:ankyrin-2-like [Crassostrea angulata]|uniref:ankyrin-2-like n=1 Tax=Magallana angulata TaxID=2784310 RepID=UPI0022B19A7F|nr:ankyrin-2-like [Crassostrea angulata]
MTESFEVLDLLHVAIEKNDLKLVVSILADNGYLVNKPRFNHTALTLALELKTNEIIEAVMACPNIDVNTVDRFGRTGLYFASKTGPISLVRKLISLGAHINQSTPSILHGCAHGESDNEAIVFALVKHGVNVDAVDERDRTPLYIAVQNSLVNVTKALIKCRANVNTAGELQSLTPLILCAGQSSTSIDANSQERYIRSLKVLNILLESGADLRLTDSKGYTALHHAIENNNILGTLKLIQWGAQHNSFTAETIQQAFETTVARNHFEIAFFILLYFYKVFCSFSFQFYCKMKEGLMNVEKVKLNIEFGLPGIETDLYLESQPEMTESFEVLDLLHVAIEKNDLKLVVSILANNGYLVNKLRFNHTALTLALELKTNEIIEAVVACPNIDVNAVVRFGRTGLYFAAKTGSISLVKKLISLGAHINQSTPSILHGCAYGESDNEAIVFALVKHGVNVDAVDERNRTPLYIAVQNSLVNVTKALIKCKANVNTAEEHRTLTPLILCAGKFPTSIDANSQQMYIRSLKVLNILLENGADLSLTDSKGYTALHHAIENNNVLGTLKLIQWGAQHNSFTAETIQQAFETTVARNHFEIAFFIFLYFYKFFCRFSFQFYCKAKEDVTKVERVKTNNFRLLLEQALSEMLAVHFPFNDSRTFDQKSMTLQILCRHSMLRKLNYSLYEKNQLGLPTANLLRRYIFFDTDFSEVSLSLLSDVHIATYTGDIASISLKANQQIVNIPLNDHTLLEIAISRKSIFITNFLLKHGADPNIETTEGLKPLHLACSLGCLNITQCLLEFGADVNALNKHENLPIHTACSAGHFHIAELLIEHGSICNSPDSNGRYPIHYSSASGNWKFTKTLLQHGVDGDVMDAFGYTGLQLASSRGNLYLLENIKLPYMFKRDLLMKGDMACLKFSSNIKWVPKQKYSQEVDHDGIIKLFLEFGCSSEIPCWTKTTQSALDTTRDFYPNGAVPLLIQKSKLN